jgi:threonine aldolase
MASAYISAASEPAACLFNVAPTSAQSIAMASVCKRHASVGLVPAGQQLSGYTQ